MENADGKHFKQINLTFELTPLSTIVEKYKTNKDWKYF